MFYTIPRLYLVRILASQYLQLFGSNLAQNTSFYTCFQSVWSWVLHVKSAFLVDKPDKPIFHKNLYIFFFTFPYTHIGNTLLVDNTPYKNIFNDLYNDIFLELFDDVHGEDQYLLGFVFPWKIFICPDMVFSPFLNIIPLVVIDVLIKIVQDFFKCHLRNAVIPANPHFVIGQNWNRNKKYLINCSSSNFSCLNISKISFWKKLLKLFNFIAWMLLVLFIFKAFGFGVVALGLNFAFMWPSGDRLMFSLIYLVVARLW